MPFIDSKDRTAEIAHTFTNARMDAAVKFFEAGILSSGAAAALAEIPRTLFLERLSHWGVAAIDMTEESFANEYQFPDPESNEGTD